MKKNIFLSIVFILSLFACRKDTPSGQADNRDPREMSFVYQVYSTPTTTSIIDLTADSAYLYSREIYLWNYLLPDYTTFNPRSYTGIDEIITADNVMQGLRRYSEGKDRFSFATSIEESDALQTGKELDYGFFIKPAYNSSGQVKWYVTYVYANSDAGIKGMTRGWYIDNINGTAIGYDNASIDQLNDLFFGTTTTASVGFIKTDGTKVQLNLTKTEFQANSVLYTNIFTGTNNKKIGYIVFNQFFGETSRNELNSVFSNFVSQGITELIVDLRNNRGGSTETQDHLANLIAPSAANGKTMYTYKFNKTLEDNKFILLKKKYNFSNNSFKPENNSVPFESNTGLTNLSRVFFIVTDNSASASELLINNLKPVMGVQIIGDTTYGKPVGYFPIELFNKVAFYPVSFKTVNGAGTADYYNGFVPDKRAADAVSKNWGDVSDPSLAAALYYINNGRYMVADPTTIERSVSPQKNNKLQSLENKRFSGMFIEK